AAQRLPPTDAGGLLQQDDERRLEGVLDVGGGGQYFAARGQHARAVAADDGLERVGVAVGAEALQQVGGGSAVEPPRRGALAQLADEAGPGGGGGAGGAPVGGDAPRKSPGGAPP